MAQASDCPCKRYRVFDLGPIGDPAMLNLPGFGYDRSDPVRVGDNSFGINDKGQVAATAQKLVSGVPSGAPHMMLWLPVDDYGITAPANPSSSVPPLPLSQWRDLHEDVWGTSDEALSVANDINDDGQVVGGYGEDLVTDLNAYLVELGVPSSGSFDDTSLHAAPSGVTLADWSMAYSINEDSVSGVNEIAGAVHLPCEGADEYLRAFRTDLNAGALNLLEGDDSQDSVAYDVRSRDTTGQTLRLVGFDGGFPQLTPCVYGESLNDCEQHTFDGLVWSPGPTPVALLPIDYNASVDNDAEVVLTGINLEDQRCGASRLTVSPSECPLHAAHWDTGVSEVPHNLNLEMPSSQADQNTIALAISDVIAYPSGAEYVVVVGWNVSTAEAVAWSRHENSTSAEDWCYRKLQDVVLPCNTDLELWAAHDVNAHGHIVGHGQRSEETFFRAFVLTDVADLNGDMRVGGADLGILIAAWNCTGGCESADCDGDGDVDGSDLGILLADWSGSAVCTIPPICASTCPPATNCGDDPEGCGSESESMAGGEESGDAPSAEPLLQVLEMIGFSSPDDFVEWALTATPEQIESVGAAIAYLIQETGS